MRERTAQGDSGVGDEEQAIIYWEVLNSVTRYAMIRWNCIYKQSKPDVLIPLLEHTVQVNGKLLEDEGQGLRWPESMRKKYGGK